jgi:hypothetical protein
MIKVLMRDGRVEWFDIVDRTRVAEGLLIFAMDGENSPVHIERVENVAEIHLRAEGKPEAMMAGAAE